MPSPVFGNTAIDINGNPLGPQPGPPSSSGQLAPRTSSSGTVTPTTENMMDSILTYGIQGTVIGFFDTVGQSVGLFDDNTVENKLKNLFPSTGGLADTYAANRSAYRATGEIVGSFLPGIAGLKLLNGVRYLREVGALGSYLKNSAAADTIFGSAVALTKSEEAVSAAAVYSKSAEGIYSGRTFANPVMDAAKKTYYSGRLMEAVRSTAAMEVGFRAFYNQSELFYPQDSTVLDQVLWGGTGLAIGAGIDFAIGRFAVRSLINAAEATAGSYSTTEIAKAASNTTTRPGDRGTAITLAARNSQLATEAVNTSSDPLLRTHAKQDLSVLGNILMKQIQEMAGDAHPLGPNFLPATTLSKEQLDLTQAQLMKNEHTLLFANVVRQLPKSGVRDFYLDLNSAFADATDEVTKAQTLLNLNQLNPKKFQDALNVATKKADKLAGALNEIHLVLDNTGDLSVYGNRADNVLDTYGFSDFKRTTFQDNLSTQRGKPDYVTRSKLTDAIDPRVTLDDNFVVTGPTPTPQIWSSLYAMGSKLLKDWKPVERQIFQLNAKTDRFQAEGIVNLVKQHPEAAPLVNFGDNITSIKDAEFQILDQKYQGFVADMENTERSPLGVPKILQRVGKLTPAEVIQKWNLPVADHLTPSPLLQVFAQARLQKAATLSELFVDANNIGQQAQHPMDLLQAAMRESVGITDAKTILPTSGKLFEQTDVRPVFIVTRSIPQLGHADAMIQAMVENRLALTMARLADIDPGAAPIVAASIRSVGRTGALNTAKDVVSLHDGFVSGHGLVTGQDRIAEQAPAIKAASLLTQIHGREVITAVGKIFDQGITPTGVKLLAKGNEPHRVDFGRIEQSYRYGWDISSIEKHADGSASFILNKDSQQNVRLLREHFGEELDRSEDAVNYMPDMSIAARKTGNTTLRVSGISADAAQAISDVSKQIGVENNALRVAQGKSAIQLRDFHLPSPDLANPNAWFVRNSQQQVTGVYSSGTTSAANKALAMDAADRLSKIHGEAHIAVAYQDVKRAHLFDPEWQNFIDYTDPLSQTGQGIKGSSAKATIDTSINTYQNMVRAAADAYINVGTRARAALFEPQLNYAKLASQQTGKSAFNENNIFDRYVATIFGRSTQSSVGATPLVGGQLYGAIENSFDRALSYVYANASEATASSRAAVNGSKALKAIVRSQSSEDEYLQYTKKLGDWSPFKTTQDWLESTHPEIAKVTAKSFASGLAKVSSTLAMRFLDVGTAINNLAGTMTTAHSVLSMMRKLPKETEEAWKLRTAAYSSQIAPGAPRTFSANRAIASTIHAYWAGELSGPLERAAQMGMFPTEYSQLERALVTKGKFTKGTLEKFGQASSYLADHSETWSKQMAWSLGYKLGMDVHKFADERNAFVYAENFVNEMVGNYSPLNKPGMFQGAVGSPLGTMQTWMYNYYRRSYGLIERQDYRSLAAAYAAQASVFGATSTPGWSAFTSTLFSNYDGSNNITTNLDKAYSPQVAELLLHGALSNIPGIFGRGDWNMNFYSRGSVDVTQYPATPVDYTRAAPMQFLASIAQGIGATWNNFMTEGGFSLQQQEEISANLTTNRAIKSIMEFAAGAKTDRGGEVISAATLDALHIAAAALGTVPASVQNAQATFNAQQTVEKHQEALRANLNDKTRALFRSGSFDVSDLQDLVAGYTRAGGNPAYFGQWLRNNVEAAFSPKVDRKIKELSTSGRWNEFINMLASLQQNQPAPTGGQNGR